MLTGQFPTAKARGTCSCGQCGLRAISAKIFAGHAMAYHVAQCTYSTVSNVGGYDEGGGDGQWEERVAGASWGSDRGGGL